MKPTHPTAAEITSYINAFLEELPKRIGGPATDREWTRQLKEGIAELGEKHDWKICTAGFNGRFSNEWLYDLVWYREDKDNHLAQVYLVLECEWGKTPAAIKYDFEKILLAKSTLKVMVCQAYDQKLKAMVDMLERGIRAFEAGFKGETYILAVFNINSNKFVLREIQAP